MLLYTDHENEDLFACDEHGDSCDKDDDFVKDTLVNRTGHWTQNAFLLLMVMPPVAHILFYPCWQLQVSIW